MILTARDRSLYADCRGECRVCLYDGGCALQDKLREMTEEQLREELEL